MEYDLRAKHREEIEDYEENGGYLSCKYRKLLNFDVVYDERIKDQSTVLPEEIPRESVDGTQSKRDKSKRKKVNRFGM